MLYDGGPRQVRPDGSIEIVGRRRIATVPVVAALMVSLLGGMALVELLPELFPLLFILWLLFLVKWPRLWSRRVAFDATARVLRVADRGRRARDRAIAFADIREVAITQREPRRVANAPPVLTVNGDELLSVEGTLANADLERELQVLVGLPPRASPKDTAWYVP